MELVHSKRIGPRTAPKTYTEDRSGCYIWTKTGRTINKDGIDIGYFRCSGCKSVKYQNPLRAMVVSSIKFNLSTSQWVDAEAAAEYQHVCLPKNNNEVTGLQSRRSIQAELAAGAQETGSQARIRIDGRLVQECQGLTEQEKAEVRSAAIGNVVAVQNALLRAKRKKYPNVKTFQEFMATENEAMHLTLRGTAATVGQAHFGEKLLLFGDNDMLIFSSPGQLRLLSNCHHIVCDGTFKFAPKGTHQVYRIFGLIRQVHSTPLVTVLLKRKTTETYLKMWQKVHDALLEVSIVNSISFANFDAEVAAYSSFAEVFPGVSVKLCSFHSKQGIYRKLQGLGLSIEYETNGSLRKIVRMIGALQITPMAEWESCVQVIRNKVIEENFEVELSEQLEKLIAYFEQTWLSKREIFCLFGYRGPRTTNHAESYHSKQRLHFSMNAKLGNWAVSFKSYAIPKNLTRMMSMKLVNLRKNLGRIMSKRQEGFWRLANVLREDAEGNIQEAALVEPMPQVNHNLLPHNDVDRLPHNEVAPLPLNQNIVYIEDRNVFRRSN